LSTSVRAANWDADVAMDGLIVELAPCDSQGLPVAVRGTVEVHLFVARTGGNRVGRSVVQLPRWVERVETSDFATGTARLQLPFGPFQPERDLTWAAYGTVHVRLNVPGQGTFQATEGMVRLRPFSPLRDQYQLETGRRWLPIERRRLDRP